MRVHARDEADREREQFERLFRAHSDAIYRFCLRRTRDPELADDARSAVFFEAWRRRDQVDLEARSPLPWLYGVAVNVLRNQRRASRRREAAQRRLPRPALHFDSVDEIAERVDATARAGAALALIDRLPPHEREVVVLCLAHGLSYSAAALALDVPVGTIRSRLARARERLNALAHAA